MTNQDAIDYLTALWNSDDLSVDETIALGMAIKALETHEERTETHACESKSCETHEERTAEPCWIPVSERLPEKNGEYLITGRQGAVNKRRYHDGHWYGNWSVLAWMPLPEPYRESEDKA